MSNRDREGRGRRSEWLVVRRCLALLRRLMQGPASADELVRAVGEALGPDAYPNGKQARQAAFKHDKEKLRGQLQVEFSYLPGENVYVLKDPGLYGRLELSPSRLKALRLLLQTFAGEVGEQAEIQDLLDDLIARLSPQDRRSLEAGALPLDLDVFQGVDPAPVNERVWQAAKRAASEHRKLSFHYLSPRHADRLLRYHEVAPYRIVYRQGHWYLHAYDLSWRGPAGQQGSDAGSKHFRLHYIQDDERLVVFPTLLPPAQRRPPRILVHYRLLPALGRGAISQHFREMQVLRLADGSAEVRGVTDDDWLAARILLGYGQHCIVLGGEEVLHRVLEAVRGMAEHYGIGDG